jgi:F-type H+-transporting ATPase subunit b
MLNIDYTLLIQIANFLILLFLLNIIAYRPIRGILNRRKEEISSFEDIAQDWRQKAERFKEELEENISETRKDGFKEKGDLKDEGVERERAMLQKAYSSVEDKLRQSRAEIGDSVSQVRHALQADLEGFSRDLAEKILGRGL